MANAHSCPYFVVGGTLMGTAASYVERRADTELLTALQAAEYCYVLDTRQVGKSSLIVRVARQLSAGGCRTTFLDLSTFGDAPTEEQWYGKLLADLVRTLHLEDEADAYWEARTRYSGAQRWFLAMRDLILPSLHAPLVVFVDEIEAVRKLPFNSDGFFAMIRALYNLRATDPGAERLTFCLAGVATPADLIRDPRTTPFNIGRRIALADFLPEEMKPLSNGLHGTPAEQEEQLNNIGIWTSGHPYLTQRFCQAVAEAGRPLVRSEIDALCGDVFLHRQAQSEEANLHFVRRQMLDDPEPTDLLMRYYRLLSSKRIEVSSADPLTDRLLLSGLAILDSDRDTPCLKVRNRIYAQVFDRRWVRANLPDADQRRQRQALWRGILRASILWAGVAVCLIFALARQREVISQQERIDLLGKTVKAAKGTLDQKVNELERKNREVTLAGGRLRTLRAENARQQKDQRQLLVRAKQLSEENHSQSIRLKETKDAQKKSAATSLASNQASYEKSETAQALMGSVVSGEEFEAVRHGLHAVLPALNRNCDPAQKAVQALSRAVSAGIYRLFRLPHGFRLETAAFSPDGQWIVTGGSSTDIFVWNAITGQRIRRFTALPGNPSSPRVWTAEFSPDGKYLVTAGSDQFARVWETSSLKAPVPSCVRTISCGDKAVNPVLARFSKTGKYLAVTGRSADGYHVKVFDIATYQEIATTTNEGEIDSLDFSPQNQRLGFDERYLALAGRTSESVHVFDFLLKKVVHTYTQSNGDPATRTAFNTWDNSLYAAGGKGAITQWHWANSSGSDTGYERRSSTYLGHSGPVSCLTTSGDGNFLATAGFNDRKVQVWLLPHPSSPLYTLHSHLSKVTSVRFSSDCSRLVTASYDGTAEVWALESRMYCGGGPVHFVSLSPNGAQIAAPTSGMTVIWNTQWDRDRFYFRNWAKHDIGEVGDNRFRGNVYHAIYSPDGKALATAADNGDVRVWDSSPNMPALQPFTRMEGHDRNEKVNCVAFSPNSLRLLSASDDRTARLWDARTGKQIGSFTHPDRVISCAFSPDGKQFLTGCADGAARLYDLGGQRPPQVLQPPGDRGWAAQRYPWSVAFSPDGRYLLTGDGDTNAYLWSGTSGKLLVTLPYEHGQVFSAQFSSDCQRVLTVGEGGYAEVWDIPAALKAGAENHSVLPSLSVHPTEDMLFGGQFSPDGKYIFVGGADCLIRKYPLTVKALVQEARRIRSLGSVATPLAK